MSLIVQKYGGTSVRDPERICNAARRILETQRAGNQVVVVVSAMAGDTNHLISLAEEVSANKEPTKSEMDALLATGEQKTIALTAMAINHIGGKAVSLTGAQAGICTDGAHTEARISDINPARIHAFLEAGNCVIVAGFQGQNLEGRTTTLGRGGSDLTAIALAAALKAYHCEILTDVDGVYTCDPRIVPNAQKIEEISYDEMLEMASSGSKVMQSRSVEFAKKFGVSFEVRNSQNTHPGTRIMNENEIKEQPVVRGISVERDQAQITLENVSDEPGMVSRIFKSLHESSVNIDMIVQNATSEKTARISFTLHQDQLIKAKKALNKILSQLGKNITIHERQELAKLSIIGIGMSFRSGIAAKMFTAISETKTNILMISTSEIKTAVAIDQRHIEIAARAVHDAFQLGNKIELTQAQKI